MSSQSERKRLHSATSEDKQFNDAVQQPTCYQSVLTCCGSFTGCLRAWIPCCCCWCPYPYKEVRQGFKGLKQNFGKFVQQLEPGLHLINPCTESIQTISLRTTVVELQRQLILTKDNITVNIDTCVYFRIVDPKVAHYKVANIFASVAQVTYATLRTICGENTLQDLLEKRQQIADIIQEYVYQKVNRWGFTLSKYLLKTCKQLHNCREIFR